MHEATPLTASPARAEVFDANEIRLSGIVQRVWERNSRKPPGWKKGDEDPPPDIFARLSIYDRFSEELRPEDHTDLRSDPQQQLPLRRAHYVTLRFPYGRTGDGLDVSLSPRMRVRVTGFVRDVPYDESLQKILTQLRLPDRIMEGDDRKSVQRVSTYVIVRTLMRLGG
jgi:hypothetical protein